MRKSFRFHNLVVLVTVTVLISYTTVRTRWFVFTLFSDSIYSFYTKSEAFFHKVSLSTTIMIKHFVFTGHSSKMEKTI